MKSLLLAPLLLMLTSCGYSSAYEARKACDELKAQQWIKSNEDRNFQLTFKCEEDVQTRQYLLIESNRYDEDYIKVLKRFGY